MNSVTLDHLPTLVLHRICTVLWNDSFNDLLAFSAVNKTCREAAAPFVFKSRIIRVSNRKQLSDDVQALTEAFSGDGCRKFLRHLTVEGTMPLLEKDVGQAFEEDELRRLEKVDAENLDDSPFRTFSRSLQTFADPPDDSREEVTRAWSPLARLISSVRFLTDLTFACTNQFPPNLLEALHQHNPSCRLNLPRFRFRSLEKLFTDPHELAIMTSPCLHSLCVRFVWIDSNGKDDHNEEAIRHAAALAPNLQHLTVADCMVLDTLGPNVYARGRTPWRGFFPPVDSSQMASLRSLSLCGHRYFADQSLWEWKNHTDFSKLKVLVLANVVQIEPLANAAADQQFMSLRELSIKLVRIRDDHFGSHAEIFFDNLQPLTVLRLFGYVTQSMVTVIAARHGGTLRNLRIRPHEPNPISRVQGGMIMKPSDILDLAKKCPRLERLHLPIKRYKSGPREIECYEALRSFPFLASVALTLDCSKPCDPEIPNTNIVTSAQHAGVIGGDEAVSSAGMQDAFINCAVDANLARSIWDIISTNKARSCRLTDLSINTSIKPNTYGDFLSNDFRFRLSQIAGSYLLKRRPNSGDSEDVEVIDRAKKNRDQLFEENQSLRMGRVLTTREMQDLDQIQAAFEKVWPGRKGSADWRENWSSRPLQKSV